MIDEALTQGLVSGSVASVTIVCFTRYIMPRLDKIEAKVNMIWAKVK